MDLLSFQERNFTVSSGYVGDISLFLGADVTRVSGVPAVWSYNLCHLSVIYMLW